MKRIADVINREVISISKETSFDDIISIMKNKGVGKLPVVSEEKVIGVVTRDDILIREEKAPLPPVIAFWDLLITLPGNKEFKSKLKKIASFKAEDIMTEEFLSSCLEDDLEEVVTKMIEEEYSYTLVMENEKLIGIVTKSDLIKNCF
ncbi:CBS domain-containing protein [uncultured Ilyobacter sp.]|jgi:CBS domain-containing protein|uniref:CBS domain-containing protein n=1 Tax=uncultured Ilyobacter sp. TaxID=544433 RepID=UPI0029C00DF4|nr:CBS domain-containing protein [uncultured Ilyobacter sp.]